MFQEEENSLREAHRQETEGGKNVKGPTAANSTIKLRNLNFLRRKTWGH